MTLKVTPQVLRMIAKEIAKSAFEMDETPDLRWAHETIDRYYGDQLTEDEKKQLINIIRLEHLDLDIRVVTSVVSETLRYQKLTSERLAIFNNPSSDHCYFWERYGKYKQSKPVLLQKTNRDTNRILEHMADPMSKEQFCSLGMVIGDVQAGKTGNYSALINKSADLGYKIIIVFTGVTENLRSQTQKRLDEDFVGTSSIAGQINQDRNIVGVGRVSRRKLELQPLPITDKNQDLKNTSSATNVQSQATTSPIIVVTKKNATLLRYLLAWLTRQESRKGEGVDTPVLIIDDEADNASVNTAKEDEDPKAVNRGIREVISACNRVTYVAYTATPFANVFIDPQSNFDNSGLVDLYPRDFIVALQAPSNYRGGKFFYYDEPDSDDIVTKQFISDAELFFPLNHKSKDTPLGLPSSLKRALRQFFITCAIKDIRRAGKSSKNIDPDDRHDSCLINVSRFKAYQNSVSSLVDVETNIILSGLQKHSEQQGSLLFNLKSEFESFFVKQKLVPEQWDQVKAALLKIGADQALHPEVVEINSASPDDLVYPKEEQRRYIAIGGFKLGRGFTLEGLTVSYFYRRSKMYDTLMQMARWFGYRDGYDDIVTLWTTKSAAGWYKSITEATEELKADLVEFERQKIEPKEFGIRVRSHEVALIITAQNKMRTGTRIKGKTRFDDKLKETFFVDVRPEKHTDNIAVSKNLLNRLDRKYTFNYFNKKETIGVFRDVAAVEVLDFLRSFEVFKGNSWSVHGLLLPFIERRSESEYSKWDVVFYLSKIDESSPKSLVERFMLAKQLRNIKTLAAKSSLSENKFLSDYAQYELPLGDHRKLATASIEGICTPGMTSEEVLEKFRKNELSGKKCREIKAKNGGNPLLVVQMMNIGFMFDEPDVQLDEETESQMRRLEILANNNTYPTYSISLPPSYEEHEGDDYIMTINDAKNYFGELESDID